MSSEPTFREPILAEVPHQVMIAWLVAVLVLGAALFIHGFDSFPLTGDELNILELATGERDIALSAGNALGFFPIVRAVAAQSRADAALRLPAIIIATLGLAMMYVLANLLFRSRFMGIASALLLSVSPIYVHHAQQVHSYAAFCAISMLSLALIWHAYHAGKRWAWIGWAVAVGASIWLHFYSVFVAASEVTMLACWVFADHRKHLRRPNLRELKNAGALLAIIGLMILPLVINWVIPLAIDLVNKTQGEKPTYEVLYSPATFDPKSAQVFVRTAQRLMIWLAYLPKLWPALGVLTLFGLAASLRRRPRVAYSLLIWLLLPIVPITVFSYYSGIDLGVRRIFFMTPVICMTWVAALEAIALPLGFLLSKVWRSVSVPRLRTAVFAGLAILLTLLVGGTALDSYYRHSHVLTVRTAARIIELNERPGDLIYSWPSRQVEYYYRGQGTFVGPLEAHINKLEEGSRLWYLRPAGWRTAAHLASNEALVKEKSAPTFILGGGLVLSVLIPEQDAASLTHKDVAATIAALRPECVPCLAQLSTQYHHHKEPHAFHRERARVERVAQRNDHLLWFR